MDEIGDTYSTGQAAKILKVNERTVRKMLDRGELKGGRDEGGSWRASQASVHELLHKRREESPQDGHEPSESIQELRSRVEDLNYRLGRSEARVELTEKAESTMAEERRRLVEDLDRERARVERLEDELREARRPWWRRVFGG